MNLLPPIQVVGIKDMPRDPLGPTIELESEILVPHDVPPPTEPMHLKDLNHLIEMIKVMPDMARNLLNDPSNRPILNWLKNTNQNIIVGKNSDGTVSVRIQ